jgi:Protein of unknown function (DUF3306)
MAAKDEGFLERWSRRKAQARGATTPSQEPAPPTEATSSLETETVAPAGEAEAASVPRGAADDRAPEAGRSVSDGAAAEPAPTLADVARLTRDSDFTRFVAPEVTGEVRNAALRKLFSDPRFNVMDGLDVYIDDYNTPDPLPAGMLSKMAQAKFLGLVKEHGARLLTDSPLPAQRVTNNVAPATPAPLTSADQPTVETGPTYENADLQLQSHHAAGRPSPESGAGEDSGPEH